MDLKQLAVLRAIAETGSFNAAGQQLGLTQPAISHQLRRLEEELGETLVLRRRPRVMLSPSGSTVLATAHRILSDVDDLKQLFSQNNDQPIGGILRVTASALGIIYLYGDLLERFIARHQRIELILTATETPHEGVRRVIARDADVAFVAFPVGEPHLAEHVLGETEHAVVVARDHPLAGRRAVSVAELKQFRFIRYETGAGSRLVSDAVFLPRGGYPEIFLESNDTEFVKRMVALGFATAIMPRFVVTREARDRRLRKIKIRNMTLKQKYGLVCRADVRMRTLRVFTEFCVQHKATIPS